MAKAEPLRPGRVTQKPGKQELFLDLPGKSSLKNIAGAINLGGGGGGGSSYYEPTAQTTTQVKKPTITEEKTPAQETKSISEFKPGGRIPTRAELGAEKSFVKRFYSDMKDRVARGFNMESQEGLSRRADRTKFTFGSFSDETPVSYYGRGGTYFPGYDKTLGNVREESFIIGDLGTPTEFKVQKLGWGVTEEYKKEVDKQFNVLQEKVTKGELTVPQAEQQLGQFADIVEERANRKFEKETKDLLLKRSRYEKMVGRSFISSKDLSDYGFAGAQTAGLIAAPFTSGLSAIPVAVSGLAEGFSSVKEDTKLAAGLKAGVGFSTAFVGVGGTVAGLEKGMLKTELESIRKGFSNKDFKAVEFKIQGEKSGISTLKGMRKFRDFTQEIKLKGITSQVNEKDFIGSGTGVIRTKGLTETPILFGKERGKYLATELFKTNFRGTSIQAGEKSFISLGLSEFKTLGGTKALLPKNFGIDKFQKELSRNINIKKTISSKDYFGGLTTQKGENLYFTRSGTLRKFGLNINPPETATRGGVSITSLKKSPQILVDINPGGSSTLTKVFNLKGFQRTIGVTNEFSTPSGLSKLSFQNIGLSSSLSKIKGTNMINTQINLPSFSSAGAVGFGGLKPSYDSKIIQQQRTKTKDMFKFTNKQFIDLGVGRKTRLLSITKTEPMVKQIQMGMQKPRDILDYNTNQKQFQLSLTKQDYRLKQELKLKTRGVNSFYNFGDIGLSGRGFGSWGGSFMLPKLPSWYIGEEPRRKGEYKRKLSRQPSLAAAYLKYDFGISMPRLSKGFEESGLFERSILTGRKRKKRR